MCRAQGYTGYGLIVCTGTAVILNMPYVIVPVSDKSLINHVCGLIADGAVRRFHDGERRLFHDIKRFHRCLAVQHIFHKMAELSKPDAAGHTFSTGLCVAQIQKRTRHIYRTKSRRAGFNSAFQIFIKSFHNDSGTVW